MSGKKVVTDWLALRDSFEPHMNMLFVETGVSEDNIRWMTNNLIACIRSGKEFHFPEAEQRISPMHKAAVRGIIAGATMALRHVSTV